MFVSFESLSSESRIWIFQANRPFTHEERSIVEEKLKNFTDQWNAHSEALKASFSVKFERFLILAVDETHMNPSGCSIDSSVRVLKEIELLTGVQLFDRNQIAFRIDGQIVLMPLQHLKQNFKEGILKGETLTFNNLITVQSQLQTDWIVPVSKTWLKRFITVPVVNLK